MVHDVNIGRDIKIEEKQGSNRKHSLPQNNAVQRNSIYGYLGHKSGDGNNGVGGGLRSDDYDEIDQIYDYVRGFAPLPKSAKGWQYIAESVPQHEDKKPEPIYQKLTCHVDAENKPPEPPPIDTIPSRKVSNDGAVPVSPPMTPPFSPPWSSPAHNNNTMMTGHNGQIIGIVPPPHLVIDRPVSADQTTKYEKHSESKKRQRPKTADPGKGSDADPKDTSNSRYVKASNKQNSTKHKFFRSRVKEKEKDVGPPPMCNLTSSQFYKESRTPSHPSFFNLRYKSLTNLAHQVILFNEQMEKQNCKCRIFQEYDTLDSSNSGGKTSFDSAGSRNVPEKRSRKLERPKSLTNLVWDFRSGGGTLMQRSNSKPSILVGGTGDRKMLDHGAGFTKRRFSKDYSPAGCNPAGKRMGSNKMATLYL